MKTTRRAFLSGSMAIASAAPTRRLTSVPSVGAMPLFSFVSIALTYAIERLQHFLVTTSGSGLDPDITPASAFYQVPRIAAARHLAEGSVCALVQSHIQARQFGILGKPRINVLELNLALDDFQTAH
jgi:hypothetical protein